MIVHNSIVHISEIDLNLKLAFLLQISCGIAVTSDGANVML